MRIFAQKDEIPQIWHFFRVAGYKNGRILVSIWLYGIICCTLQDSFGVEFRQYSSSNLIQIRVLVIMNSCFFHSFEHCHFFKTLQHDFSVAGAPPRTPNLFYTLETVLVRKGLLRRACTGDWLIMRCWVIY